MTVTTIRPPASLDGIIGQVANSTGTRRASVLVALVCEQLRARREPFLIRDVHQSITAYVAQERAVWAQVYVPRYVAAVITAAPRQATVEHLVECCIAGIGTSARAGSHPAEIEDEVRRQLDAGAVPGRHGAELR
jgi:hypothetical protein